MSPGCIETAPPPQDRWVLLWCMRVWVMERRTPVGADWRILEAMTLLDAPHLAAALDRFMDRLRQGATRTLSVRCTCQAAASEDETALLDAIALLQQQRRFEALLLLRGLLTPACAAELLAQGEAIGHALARVGRFLQAPELAVTRRAFGAAAHPRGGADG